MNFFRITLKLLTLISLAMTAMGVMFYYSLGSDKASPNAKQKAYRKKWLQKVVKVIGLEVEVKRHVTDVNTTTSIDTIDVAHVTNQPDVTHAKVGAVKEEQYALWVSNHISWMDIVVIGSQGVGFLSKIEVRKWPLIGWLGNKSGTVFIDRGRKNASQAAAKAIAEKIFAGDNLLVFPEGTTSSGENVKRFHARIFAPALDHQLHVQPIAIQYLDENGQPHPKSVWIEQSFMSNILGVLAQPSIRVVMTFLPIVDSQQFTERRQLAELVESQIRDVVLTSAVVKIT